ncbi:MAG: hypothetical protein ACFUZC_16260 [Chthoniobacteraceae bacterium]
MSKSDYLFCRGDLRPTIENLGKKLIAEIGNLSPSQLLPADDAHVCEHFVGKNTVNPIELHEEAMELIEPREVVVEEADRFYGGRYTQKYLEFRLELPFTGDAGLFECKPSSWDLNPPSGQVTGDRVVFTHLSANNDSAAVKQALSQWIASVKKYIDWQRSEIDAWNNSLAALVRQHVMARRQKLVADNQLITDLGIPVRRRGDPPASYNFPVQRKTVVPSLPPHRPGALAKPEPVLEAAVYDEILDTLAGMSIPMERCPSAFANLDEEALRMQFLIPLNGMYQGQASGETFNASGKTDILIKKEDRILFVAECKFWRGAQSLKDTIDQLLSYLTWRETKAAILLFNRNKDFSSVLAQIPGVIQQHPQFVRMESYNKSTGFRFVVRHPNDAARHLIVTILAFDVPQSA